MLVLAAALAAAASSATLAPAQAAALGKRAVAILTAFSKEGDAEARALAAAAWGQIGNRAAVGILKAALADKNVIVRIEAATSLHKLGDDESAKWALTAIIAKGGEAAAPATPQEQMRRLARDQARAKSIARLSEFGGEEAVNLFELTLKDPSPAVREATSLALARMGLEEFGKPFLEALRDKDETVRATAVRALGAIARPEYLGPVRDACGDASAAVRLEAVDALPSFKDADVSAPLAQGLRDSDPRVRAKALLSLSKLADQESRPLLRAALKEAKAPEAALKAAAGLARRGESVDLGLVDRSLRLKDPDLKTLALEVLKASSGEDAILLLARAMDEDAEPRTRLQAAAAVVKRLQRRQA